MIYISKVKNIRYKNCWWQLCCYYFYFTLYALTEL